MMNKPIIQAKEYQINVNREVKKERAIFQIKKQLQRN